MPALLRSDSERFVAVYSKLADVEVLDRSTDAPNSIHERHGTLLLSNIYDMRYSLGQREGRMHEADRILEDLIHQLRTPLVVAVARASWILDHDPPVTLERDLRAIRGLCQKAHRVAASASLFGLFHSGVAELSLHTRLLPSSELLKLLIEAAKDTAALVDSRRNIAVRVPRSLSDIDEFAADPLLLNQAVLTILDNAAKYSFNDTTIDIDVKRTRKYVGIDVVNVGVALTKWEIPRCTERGWRGEAAQLVTGEGSGLGLWIVDHIMTAHGGRIEVNPTTRDHKTRFTLLFPSGATR